MDVIAIAKQFEQDGFVIVRQLFSSEEITTCERHLNGIIANQLSNLPAGDVYYEDSPTKEVKSIFRMHDRSMFFMDLMQDRRLTQIVAAIWPTGQVIPEGVMFFGKSAKDGSEAPPHQDNTFQCWNPPMALTATVSIDQSTPENGPLTCQRGSHELGMLTHRQSGVMGFSRRLIDPLDTARLPEVQLCMKPGDVAFHHINAVHRSGPNKTNRPRRQLGIGYRSSLARRDEEAFDRYQQDLTQLHRHKAASAP